MIARSMRAGLAWWMWMALAGCRLGFDRVASDAAGDDDAADPTVIELRVVGDAYLAEPGGAPIAGATVLVDRGAGLERALTDAAGVARFPPDGVRACHVVFKGDLGWRVYTVVAPHAGVIELGGRAGSDGERMMTVALPDNASDNYTLRLPEHCGFPPGFPIARLDFTYNAPCDGQAVHAIGFADGLVGGIRTYRYVDAGQVTLAKGSTVTVPGPYRALPRQRVDVTNLAPSAGNVSALILERTGLDLLPLASTFDAGATTGTTATINTFAAPGGNAVSVIMSDSNAPIQYSSTSEVVLPVTIAQPLRIDAAAFVPPFSSLVLTHPPSVAWTGAPGGTILILETISGMVQWDAYLDPTATEVAFPALPAVLGVPTPTSFDFATLIKLDVPGATTDGLIRTIDRTWPRWPRDPALFPAAGATETRILYTVALGPP